MPKDIRWNFSIDCQAEVIEMPDGAWVNVVRVLDQSGNWIAIDTRNVDLASEERAMNEAEIFEQRE
jgi:hypothetical protein